MLKRRHILDITTLDRNGLLYKALQEYNNHMGPYANGSYWEFDAGLIEEFIHNESDQDLQRGWWDLLRLMQQADCYHVVVHYWW